MYQAASGGVGANVHTKNKQWGANVHLQNKNWGVASGGGGGGGGANVHTKMFGGGGGGANVWFTFSTGGQMSGDRISNIPVQNIGPSGILEPIHTSN